jgi:hypothetical protein
MNDHGRWWDRIAVLWEQFLALRPIARWRARHTSRRAGLADNRLVKRYAEWRAETDRENYAIQRTIRKVKWFIASAIAFPPKGRSYEQGAKAIIDSCDPPNYGDSLCDRESKIVRLEAALNEIQKRVDSVSDSLGEIQQVLDPREEAPTLKSHHKAV